MKNKKNKKIPLRKCLGCNTSFSKQDLMRVVKVKQEDGSYVVKFDKFRKLSGRGAYICNNIECFKKAYKSKRLERTLDMKIPEDVYEQLKEEIINYE